jgi:hypothetical protein
VSYARTLIGCSGRKERQRRRKRRTLIANSKSFDIDRLIRDKGCRLSKLKIVVGCFYLKRLHEIIDGSGGYSGVRSNMIKALEGCTGRLGLLRGFTLSSQCKMYIMSLATPPHITSSIKFSHLSKEKTLLTIRRLINVWKYFDSANNERRVLGGSFV